MGTLNIQSEAHASNRSQIFTPPTLADFMAGMLDLASTHEATLLDAGAGAGALSESALNCSTSPIQLTMVEKDEVFAGHLADLLSHHGEAVSPGSSVVIGDFIATANAWIAADVSFTHVIMNPPYRRIQSGSPEQVLLDSAGVRTSNLYAAFLWLGMDLLRDGGRLIAVVPRSVLSGVQFRRVRRHLLAQGSLFRLHHFRNRRAVFQRDSVLQEVVVLGLIKGAGSGRVSYSQSEDLSDVDVEPALLPTERLVESGADDVILVPVRGDSEVQQYDGPLLPSDVTVSVGSVVDFRIPDEIVAESSGSVPLVGSELFSARPRSSRRMKVDAKTARFVMPPGKYVVVKRISPPETRPRLQHRVLDATEGAYADGVAFENHVLVLHCDGAGLPDETCTLLSEQLGADGVQSQIRERTGSTQINVADVRALRRQRFK